MKNKRLSFLNKQSIIEMTEYVVYDEFGKGRIYNYAKSDKELKDQEVDGIKKIADEIDSIVYQNN